MKFTTPLFPATVRKRGQLYYERGLSVTAPVTGNVAGYLFSCNGAFDPNITGTGHQPMGFDQMMSMYNQYTVIQTSINIHYAPLATLIARAALTLLPSTTIPTDPSQLMENGLTVSNVYDVLGTSILTRVPSLSLNCDLKRYFGRRSDAELKDDVNLYGTAAANPTEQAYFAFCVWQLNANGSDTTVVQFDVLLEYDIMYWEPKKLAVS